MTYGVDMPLAVRLNGRYTNITAALLLVATFLFCKEANSNTPPDRRPTVAVLYFDYAGAQDDLGELQKGLAQMLISDLSVCAGLRLVERERLEAVLAELRLTQTAKLAPATIGRLGSLLGARYLILGSYAAIRSTLRIDARIIEVETGRIVSSLFSAGPPDEFFAIEQKLSAALRQKLGEPLLEDFPARAPPSGSLSSLSPGSSGLRTQLVRELSHALEATDRGEFDRARSELGALLRRAPGFRPAAERLDRLLR